MSSDCATGAQVSADRLRIGPVYGDKYIREISEATLHVWYRGRTRHACRSAAGIVLRRHDCDPRASRNVSGRVEDGRGGLGLPASPRFPSPLIERSMRISRTTLSDWLHRNAHDVAHDRSRLSGGRHLRTAAELLPTSPGTSGVCRLSPITMPSRSSEAYQKSGPFPPPALPGLNSRMTLSESRRHRRPGRR